MTTLIKKSDSLKVKKAKISNASKIKEKNIMELFGSIKLKFDPIEYQRETRGDGSK